MKQIELLGGGFAIVDDSDFEMVNKFKWRRFKGSSTFYAHRHRTKGDPDKPKTINMHRFILGLTDPRIITDHKNGNGLDNRRDNLRIATHCENMANRKSHKGSTSKYLGVHWDKNARKWKAVLQSNKMRVHLGSHDSEIEAALAYNKAAIKHHGEFARLNSIN